MRTKIALSFVIPLVILLVFFLSLSSSKKYSTNNLVGNQIEIFTVNGLNKDVSIRSSELTDNNYTLINFWASWCSPCRKEHKNLMKLSKYGNLKIVGINFKDEEKKAKNFLDEMGNPFFILAKDPDGKKSVNFGIYGIPETILINKDLKILKKYIGPLNFKDVSEIKKITQK